MDFKKAMQRIGWRLQQPTFKPNNEDKQAYNAIVQVIESQQKQQFKNHELFAKLYIHIYGKFISHYKTTVLDVVPRKELHKILETPMSILIEKFTKEMNDSELYTLMEKSNIKIDHPAFKNEHEKKEDAQKIDMKNLNIWKQEDVSECLENDVNHAINLQTIDKAK